jgi:hypothetical protein
MNLLDPLRELEKEIMGFYGEDRISPGTLVWALRRVIERMEKASPVYAGGTCHLCGGQHDPDDHSVRFAKKHVIKAPPQPEARWTIEYDGVESVFTVRREGELWRASFAERADAEAFVAMKEGRK